MSASLVGSEMCIRDSTDRMRTHTFSGALQRQACKHAHQRTLARDTSSLYSASYSKHAAYK
eukprot:9894526-Alexandrium_andersonii.AAC.1